MQSVEELVQCIRDMTTAERRHWQLRQEAGLFSQLGSSLDVIGDTESALSDYIASEQAARTQGERYLLTYGVLQALVLQQDAVRHLSEALGVDCEAPAEFIAIRDVRNRSVGHPTRRDRAGVRSFNHVSRISMAWKGFDLLTFYESGRAEIQSVDVPGLIETQRSLIAAALIRIVDTERGRENRHRRRHRSVHLTGAFGTGFDHALHQLREELRGCRSLGAGPAGVALARDAVERLRTLLTERGELPAWEDVFGQHAGPALNALDRLGSFVESGPSTNLSPLDADNHWLRLRHELDALRDLAREIDREYERDL